jgi:hypothetical protein
LLALALGERGGVATLFGRMIREARIHFTAFGNSWSNSSPGELGVTKGERTRMSSTLFATHALDLVSHGMLPNGFL